MNEWRFKLLQSDQCSEVLFLTHRAASKMEESRCLQATRAHLGVTDAWASRAHCTGAESFCAAALWILSTLVCRQASLKSRPAQCGSSALPLLLSRKHTQNWCSLNPRSSPLIIKSDQYLKPELFCVNRISGMRNKDGAVHALTYRVGRHIPGAAHIFSDILRWSSET